MPLKFWTKVAFSGEEAFAQVPPAMTMVPLAFCAPVVSVMSGSWMVAVTAPPANGPEVRVRTLLTMVPVKETRADVAQTAGLL